MNFYKVVLITIVATIAVVLFFQFRNKSNDKINAENKALFEKNLYLEHINDSLQKKNDSINIQLILHDFNINELHKQDSVISIKFEQTKSDIKKLKTKYEKVSHIDTFKSNDILRYFADSLGHY